MNPKSRVVYFGTYPVVFADVSPSEVWGGPVSICRAWIASYDRGIQVQLLEAVEGRNRFEDRLDRGGICGWDTVNSF